jgi:MATE family multidrug resistance protein
LTAFGVLRGLQDMRTPLWVALGLNVLNIVLDALMIFGFAGFTSTGLLAIPAMGVAGAAYASIIAQWLGALWAAGIVIRRLGWTWQFQWQEMTHLFKAGGDLFIRTGLLNFFVLFSTRLANQMGPESGAAYQAIRQVWLFLAISMDALALTAQSLIGYFIGAGQVSQAKQVAWWCALWGIGLGVIAGLGMWLGQGAVASLLVPVEALAVFGPAWRVAALSQPINVLAFVTDGIHWGTGDYAFLRNAMLAATGIGCLGLLLFTQLADSLVWLWVVIGLWGMARAGFGVARIWPGWGDSPFKQADRYEAVEQSP